MDVSDTLQYCLSVLVIMLLFGLYLYVSFVLSSSYVYCTNITAPVLDFFDIHHVNVNKRILRSDEKTSRRKGRIIAFNMDDDSNVTVELGFNVPFLKVPVRPGRSKRGAGSSETEERQKPKPLVEVNAGGIIVAGVLAATILFIVPTILRDPPTVTRSDTGKDILWRTVSEFDAMLASNSIDSSSCAQKTVCWIVKNTKNGIMGNYLNSFSKSWLVSKLMSGTSIHKAVEAGRTAEDCSESYPSCPVSRHHIDLLADTLVSKFSSSN